MSPSPRLFLGSLLLPLALASCAPSPSSNDCAEGKCDSQPSALGLCTAIRGNGQLITAHFASLARIVEHFGMIDGAAGGSSASITVFMTESMQANPNISDCGDRSCDTAERNARAALLLKSFPGYVQHLSTTDEAAAVGQLLPLVAKIKAAGIDSLLDEDAQAGIDALTALLESDDLRDLINPELIGLLQNSPNPEQHARDILEGVQKLGSFAADSDTIFIRPGLLSFPALADKLGRAGDFYAGNGPADQASMQRFMEACASPGRDKSWFEVAALPAGEESCGQLFDSMLGSYRAALAADPDSFASRIDEPVGGKMAALISTSILSGESADSWRQARADYNQAQPYTFTPSFSDVSFGYWGRAKDLEKVAANDQGYQDLKTSKFRDLGQASWREVLSFSPAEPGLARALELDDELVSFGGWSDLSPVMALRNIGCENVVYVTRRGEESSFATGVATLLGMSSAEKAELYDLDANSSYTVALEETDATWCTDWNNKEATDLLGITLDGYNAPMEATSEYFTRADPSYDNLSEATGLRGCTPGAAAAP